MNKNELRSAIEVYFREGLSTSEIFKKLPKNACGQQTVYDVVKR
jgi:transposase